MAKPCSDAIEKLEADHDRVEAIFEKLKTADDPQARRLGIQVCNMLKIHMTLEEELLYPALRGQQEADEDKLDEGLIEHDSGKVFINDILADPDQDKLTSKLQVLGEHMEHHHGEEEDPDKGIFAQARAAGIDLVEMIEKMDARETELKAELKDSDLPPTEMNFVDVNASPS